MISINKRQAAVLYDILCDGHVRGEMLKMAKEAGNVWKNDMDRETDLSEGRIAQRWLESVDDLIQQLSPIVESEDFFLPDHLN